MSKCVNDNCKNNPFDNEIYMVLATSDGDFACCENCRREYEKQKATFFSNIPDDAWYENYMKNKY